MSFPWVDFGKKAAIGTVAGVGASRGLRLLLDMWRKKKGLPPVNETPPLPVMEGSGLILSILAPNSPVSPYLFGLCAGRVAEMYSPIVYTLSGLEDLDWGKVTFRKRSAEEAAKKPFVLELERAPIASSVGATEATPETTPEPRIGLYGDKGNGGTSGLGMDVTVVNGTVNGMESDALPVEPWKTWDYQKHHIEEKLTVSDRVFQFPEGGRRILLREFVTIIRDVTLKPSFNKVKNQEIPAGYCHPAVVYRARQIIAEANVNPRDPIAVAEAVTLWCQKHIRYSYDPNSTLNEDWLFHPYRVLETIGPDGKSLGFDCDDLSNLTCSMMLSLGFKPVFILWGQDKDKPYEYGHISTALYVPEYKEKTGINYYNMECTPRKNGTYQKPGDWTQNAFHCVVQMVPGDF